MRKINHRVILILLIGILIVTAACGTGYTTTRTSFNNEGKVILKKKSLDGNDVTEVEIDEDLNWDTLNLDILVEVSAGTYKVTFEDDDGQAITLEASGGSPATGSTSLTMDALGEITLMAEGHGAEEVKITIEYSRK